MVGVVGGGIFAGVRWHVWWDFGLIQCVVEWIGLGLYWEVVVWCGGLRWWFGMIDGE